MKENGLVCPECNKEFNTDIYFNQCAIGQRYEDKDTEWKAFGH